MRVTSCCTSTSALRAAWSSKGLLTQPQSGVGSVQCGTDWHSGSGRVCCLVPWLVWRVEFSDPFVSKGSGRWCLVPWPVMETDLLRGFQTRFELEALHRPQHKMSHCDTPPISLPVVPTHIYDSRCVNSASAVGVGLRATSGCFSCDPVGLLLPQNLRHKITTFPLFLGDFSHFS